MRRYALIGLVFTIAVTLMVFPLIVPQSRRAPQAAPAPFAAPGVPAPGMPAPGALEPGAPAPRAMSAEHEERGKRLRLKGDMEATAQLCRIECKRDIGELVSKAHQLSASGNDERSRTLRQMVREHPHFQALEWREGNRTVSAGAVPSALRAKAGGAWAQGREALKRGDRYESPSFELGGERVFVLAEPGDRPGEGIAALIREDIVRQVEKHQLRNLRLVPYPAEGRYRIESVRPNTLQDTTVSRGEDNGDASHYAIDEVVVKFRRSLTPSELLRLRKELQLTVVRKHRGNTYLFRSKRYKTEQLIVYFRNKWKPVFAEPHYLYLTNDSKPAAAPRTQAAASVPADLIPNDTLYSKYQWNLPEIATEQGWRFTKGNRDIVVAVVDTGVQLDHPDLKGRLVNGTNIVDPSAPPEDDVGHGTHVAGIIAAEVNNHEGVAGMTWYTKIMPVKALDSTGAGTTYSVAEGIIWAADHGAQVINLSLGNYAQAQFLHDAIKYAYDKGVVVVAASGNDNTDRPGYPAAYPEVIAVGATDPDERRASYSNYGDYIDVTAPGTQIASTYPGSRYAALSGTSMASPHVSALVSLIRAANPQMSNADVVDVMRKTAKDLGAAGKDNDFGYGQIDVLAAVAAVGGQSGSPAAASPAAPETNTSAGTGTLVLTERLLDRLQQLLTSFFGRR
ncbi:S8 family peptidase [Cohnella sp. REN36]|uniref:S8 family peptidase n=1 Tax=Cohnella sp. REN36 TaxID=2887347 RepID=UPI001D158C62|nr:S8 family peptidase [Cohnella sp. REN36]MCC3372822.1 S8 family peptidase [Cohnella sp. REN36]